MIYYCDTEFTKFNGELLSIALVPEHEVKLYFYEQLRPRGEIDPWVVENVMPHMNEHHWNDEYIDISRKLQNYLKLDDNVTIIADWPEDLTWFMRLLITGAGTMINVDNITCKLQRISGHYNSKVPHHALSDAIAIREYWKGNN